MFAKDDLKILLYELENEPYFVGQDFAETEHYIIQKKKKNMSDFRKKYLLEKISKKRLKQAT
jgi:hypothetical protein